MFTGITTIFFDLDNTLINRDAAFLACLEHFFGENMPDYYFGNEQFEIEKKDQHGYTTRAHFCEWFIHHYQPKGWDETNFWNYIKTNISNFVPPISIQLKAKLLHLQKNYKIGILTNGSIINQSRKIRQAKLDAIVPTEAIYIAQQFQLSKPNKRLFELILEQEGISANQMLYIGDDPVNDVLGAAQVGIQTAWVSHKRAWTSSIKPDFILENIFHLPI
ncbi:HAD family hydrolase [Aureispira anguillae]|uniref:HAD family hydrolase n=1 Tax=Aureispira anguillae TaxID=2864201 RepID=A0A915YHG4_9BACT|nr:HAD family hydrolase [Aureispira anguillae]BDS13265.1 HAD family hydrolase [Aureispira anguillae]